MEKPDVTNKISAINITITKHVSVKMSIGSTIAISSARKLNLVQLIRLAKLANVNKLHVRISAIRTRNNAPAMQC
jgi:hypothetical protein